METFHPPTVHRTLFGKIEFDADERERIRTELRRKLEKEDVLTRPGPGGGEARKKVHIYFLLGVYTYLESCRAIELANEIFGYCGWSCSIVDITQDFVFQLFHYFFFDRDID